MSDALTLASDSPLAAARRWAEMPEADLKRDAATAARDRDAETLWAITRAHLILRGRSGASISRHTLASYKTSVYAVIAAFAGTSLLSPHRDSAAVWIRTLEESGKSPGTVTVRLAGARSFYAALRWTGATTADPFQDVRPARDMTPADEKRKPYPDGDLDRLLEYAGPEDAVLILCGYHAGLRISEILALTFEDLDLSARTLTVKRGKGGKRRSGVISRRLLVALQALPYDSGPVIQSIRSAEGARYRMRRLCKMAGTEYRACHSLRHAAGTRLMRERRDLDAVARFLGHEQVETSRIYSKWSDETLKNSVGEW